MSKAQLDEGRKATPLKGHPYHEKSDDELHYIIKDAGEAAHASRGLSSEGKYLDQVNDASTVLYHRKMGGKQVVKPKNEEVDVDEAVVAKATLEKYRKKNKERFQAKGGLSAAFDKLDKQDKKAKKPEVRKEEVDEGADGPHSVEFYDARERKAKAKWHYDRTGKQRGASLSKGIKNDYEAELLRRGVKDSNGNQKPLRKEEVEPIEELNRKTLKSYQRKATTSAQRAWDKGDKEEDKAMSTDGNKYPEKQARHQAAANVQHAKWTKRDAGLKLVQKRLATKEEVSIVDMVMVQDEIEASPYISEIEARCDALVSAIKDEMKQTIFALEGHSVKQLKQAASHHRLHKNANEKAAESPSSRKYGTENQFRMKAHKHDKARKVADGLRHRMDDAGVSHSSRLPKGK